MISSKDEDESLERKFGELTDLMGQVVLDMILGSLRKTVKENQVVKEWSEAKLPIQQEEDSS